jgi:hypothetical protein
MLDYYDFDTVPYEVTPQQLGPDYDPQKARKEARTTVNQLIRTFGEPPFGSRFKIVSNPHEFGNYYSIQFVYNDENEETCDYLAKVENDWPNDWDKQALEELNFPS